MGLLGYEMKTPRNGLLLGDATSYSIAPGTAAGIQEPAGEPTGAISRGERLRK